MNELRWILIGFGIALLAGIYLWGRRGGSGAEARQSTAPRLEPDTLDYSELDTPTLARKHEAAAEPPEPARQEEPTVEAVRVNVSAPRAQQLEPPSPVADECTDDVREPLSGSILRETVARRMRREPTLGTIDLDAAQTSHPGGAARVEPTLDEPITASRPPPSVDAEPRTPSPAVPAGVTTSSLQRRRIFAVRLVAPVGQGYAGDLVRAELEADGLRHGKYGIFHLCDVQGETLFSVASMVEPGTFDLADMAARAYPGLTFFTVVPAPRELSGPEVLDRMLGCARRLQDTLSGTLQDDRGGVLTALRAENMRSEAGILDAAGRAATTHVAGSPPV